MFEKLFKLTQNKRNLFYTILICLNMFAYGIVSIISGPPMVDLKYIYDVPLNTMAYLAIPGAIGYLIGACASYTSRLMSRQLMLILAVLIMAACVLATPFYGQFWLLCTMSTISGVGSGAWDSSSSIWLVEIWPVGNAAMMQVFQFMYGAGNIVGPLLMAPYVYGNVNKTSDGRLLSISDRIHSLAIPYAVTGIAQAIVPILFLILFFTYPYKKISKSSNQDKKSISKDSSVIRNRKLKIALCGLCIATYSTTEMSYIIFATTMWQYLDIGLSANAASHLDAVLTSTYTFGRLATAFIALKLKPDFILTYHYCTIFGSLIWIFYFQHNLTFIYVGTAVLGYGFSAIWPAMFAFTEQHIKLTDKIASLYSFLSGAVGLVVPLVLGQVFQKHPAVLFGLEFVFLSASLVVFVLLKIMIWKKK